MVIGIGIALIIVMLDQLSKYLILNYVLAAYPYIKITSFFNVVNAWNTGVSFSLFSEGGYLGTLLLSFMAIIISAMLVWQMRKNQLPACNAALGLIVGGALGNVIDRIRVGAVFDFLDFHIDTYHWPAFNFADSAICIGAVLILFISLKNKKTEKK
ncbi:MAG: signal peptidase II [Alphaproteobacteria bacterium]|nr:signal peptidase II [Alphaproteobacteria bacterium]